MTVIPRKKQYNESYIDSFAKNNNLKHTLILFLFLALCTRTKKKP